MKFLILILILQIFFTFTISTSITCNFFEDFRKSYACEVLSIEIVTEDTQEVSDGTQIITEGSQGFQLIQLDPQHTPNTPQIITEGPQATQGSQINTKDPQLTPNTPQIITSITGNHLTNRSTESVKYFTSQHQKIEIFPRNLENFFPRLETFSIYNASLKEISRDDLKFPELRKLMLYYNEIEIIDSDLFEFTPKIFLISLLYNRIKIVESGTFDGLHKLTLLHFHNPCHQGDAFNQRIAKNLIKNIYENCKNFSEEENFENLKIEKLEKLLRDLMKENQELKIKLKELRNE